MVVTRRRVAFLCSDCFFYCPRKLSVTSLKSLLLKIQLLTFAITLHGALLLFKHSLQTHKSTLWI